MIKIEDIPDLRLSSQHILKPTFDKPSEVVRYLGAVQSQDYKAGLWAIALRTKEGTIEKVEKEIAQGKIVRTWPMRGTLHFVAPEDIRWMIDLLTPKIIKAAKRRHGFLGLNDAIFTKARKIFIKFLEGGKQITRPELFHNLEKAGISTKNYRGGHMLGHFAREQLVCFGPRKGKQPTIVLLDEWVPKKNKITRDEAIGKLVLGYFTSHGPATLYDLNWWSGLTIAEIKRGLEMAKSKIRKEEVNGKNYYMSSSLLSGLKYKSPNVHLLPPFDEYVVAYKDRTAVLEAIHNPRVFGPGNGVFSPIIVLDGQVIGIWRSVTKKNKINLSFTPFKKLTKNEETALQIAAQKYERAN